mmetsp:Transcript_25106/g.38922  ORF Transcript_25106/g.38922 Transcript_25106/m.38922 type:complete len:80 (-) Transcript_25106:79-318(-)|eukprot:CAMPEP_0170499640 /NCGR_PEP_ID=MMETSP0208-20121228/32061_1 /TAXON_ID=197538 /ORGANISM="Strombidium inclinatum, Strain S3" /LENGTH=79 /DNA_ID=CAMNT_0010777275 /DNA_START=351 /DNA_END=590 /DNA_ORIENTATION=+
MGFDNTYGPVFSEEALIFHQTRERDMKLETATALVDQMESLEQLKKADKRRVLQVDQANVTSTKKELELQLQHDRQKKN